MLQIMKSASQLQPELEPTSTKQMVKIQIFFKANSKTKLDIQRVGSHLSCVNVESAIIYSSRYRFAMLMRNFEKRSNRLE